MARGRGSGKKSGSKPTSRARAAKQSIKSRYARAREDAQLIGLIPTTPEGALKPERVSPSVQTDQPLPELIGQAVRKGWAVPEATKPRLVDELISIVENPELPAKVKVSAFGALRQADKDQYERDNPEAAGKAKGGNKVTVGIGNKVDVSSSTGEVFSDIEQDIAIILGEGGMETSDVPEDGTTESVDEAESDNAEEEREAD